MPPTLPACPGWRLVVWGDGPERPRLEALATESGVGDRVQLPGQSPSPGAWLEQAGIFALTSSYEGYPNALAEAMAAGLAVVSTACPIGPRTMVRHGVDGLLVANGDLQELSQALGQLMRDPSLRSRLGTACRDSRRAATPEEAVANWTELLLRAVGPGVHTSRSISVSQGRRATAIPFASRERLMLHTWSRSQFPRVRVAWFCDRPAWAACFTLAEFKQCTTAERRFGFVRRPFHTKLVDLRPAPEEILAGFQPRTRTMVRRAQKLGVTTGVEPDRDRFRCHL